jgi:6-phosphogluconate dehydrogenase
MVHNGIEYGDMQLIAEAYDVLRRRSAGSATTSSPTTFAEWNRGELESFLIEITAQIFRKKDPEGEGHLVDKILDATGMKGTGKWTVQDAADLGAPSPPSRPASTRACSRRARRSAWRPRRCCPGPCPRPSRASDKKPLSRRRARGALLRQDHVQLRAGHQPAARGERDARGWGLDLGEIARIWQDGCIIRARFLGRIKDAYVRDPKLDNLLLDPTFRDELAPRQGGMRRVVAKAAEVGLPLLGMGASLGYYDMVRRERLPANLTQAQRDYFGAHTYKRVDREGDFHTDWRTS